MKYLSPKPWAMRPTRPLHSEEWAEGGDIKGKQMEQELNKQKSAEVKKIDLTITTKFAYFISFILIILALIILLIHMRLWGINLLQISLNFFSMSPIILAMILLFITHEILHGLGFVLFGHVSRDAVQFGMKWKSLIPFAHCKVPLIASSYRYALLLPNIALSVIPVTLGLMFGIVWFTLWGAIMLVGAGGDIAIVWKIRSLPANARVIDHPVKLGCIVLIEK